METADLSVGTHQQGGRVMVDELGGDRMEEPEQMGVDGREGRVRKRHVIVMPSTG